jgi:hypothetical protein
MTQTAIPNSPGPVVPRRAWLPAAVICGLFAAAALPLILSGNTSGRGAFDAVNFHEPVARMFARELPRPDFSNYIVTTTPGYHLFQALIVRYVSDRTVVMQLAGLAIAIGFLGTLTRACAGWSEWKTALACCLPVACSPYVFQSGVWVLPDNAGWWGVLAVMLTALSPRFDRWRLLVGSLVLLLLVMMRQIHLWAAATLWTAAWLGPERGSATDQSWTSLLDDIPSRLPRMLAALGESLPAVAAVAYFAWLWRGLTPPVFQSMYTGLGWSAPALILAILAVASTFYIGHWIVGLRRLWRDHRGLLLLAAFVGLLAAALPITTIDVQAGRSSGLWHVTDRLGYIAGRTSVVLLLLSSAGGVALASWTASLGFHDRWLMLGAFAAFSVAQAASPMVWQRYNEPFILLTCAIMACRITDPRFVQSPVRAARVVGPVALAVLLASISARVIVGSAPTGIFHIDPKARELPKSERPS